MKLDQFAKMRGFQTAHSRVGAPFIDHFLNGESGDELRAELKLKRIQFDTVPQLYERLENACSLLDCSKREFLEMAVWDAIERSESVFMDSYKEAAGSDFLDDFSATAAE